MANKVDTKKVTGDDGKSLGVLYTGYLDKKNPVTGSFKRRFVVLTLDSLHWFKRSENYDLFGEERGQILLGSILTTRILDEDSTTFEVQSTDARKRLFRATTSVVCEEWVSAVRSAIKLSTNSNNKKGINRRTSLAGIKNFDLEDSSAESFENSEVVVLLMSLNSASKQTEVVIARKPEWNRVISVPIISEGDQILISTSNGGIVRLNYDCILAKAEEGVEFDISVQNVTLASSLKISLSLETVSLTSSSNNNTSSGSNGINSSNGNSGKIRKKKGQKPSNREVLAEMAVLLANERGIAINLVLSIMVMMIAVSSLRAIGVDTSLLFVFALMLSLYNFHEIWQRAYRSEAQAQQSASLRVLLHGHNFTSPDAPIKEPEDEIPKRFLDGCDGDVKEARRRWDITRHWRETEGVNNILREPQPHFQLIRSMYPHYHAGRGKEGHLIFWERPGDFQGAQLAGRGVKVEDMVRHWLFTTEYQWEVMLKGDPVAKSIAVIDVQGVSLSDLAGSNLEYIKKTINLANQHYPERAYVVFMVNAPFFASIMWKMVKPLVHENTQNKVKILSAKETLKGLQEHIDISQIPEYYGGQLDFGGSDSCRFSSPESLAINEFVRMINEGSVAPASRVPFSDTTTGTATSGISNSSDTTTTMTTSGNNCNIGNASSSSNNNNTTTAAVAGGGGNMSHNNNIIGSSSSYDSNGSTTAAAASSHHHHNTPPHLHNSPPGNAGDVPPVEEHNLQDTFSDDSMSTISSHIHHNHNNYHYIPHSNGHNSSFNLGRQSSMSMVSSSSSSSVFPVAVAVAAATSSSPSSAATTNNMARRQSLMQQRQSSLNCNNNNTDSA